ncbi:BTB/POZ domain-containing protein At5g66560 isoform X1 [Amborella trichopoda]|uniref:NPH3 domain-containing protein n=1 Tax=Amborella trichopoda TaxID=13333 RepID=U5CWE9_AMBTC|nr:BTB/POZ domain-containing protein At5g66560 isoform X1 [Amborella trichopoda]ERN17651.1 hypothetical protein AMTR_s00059p00182270 [Amborella trichopoda]|eukprot:XP_006856184.1 BTB/POZ domain-containing protein At5g66560 isoform X1 [Amborella trichopoda]
MASEKLASKGQAWFCTTGLPSDIVIEVEGMSFHLHKFPLLSRSGRLHRLISQQEANPKPTSSSHPPTQTRKENPHQTPDQEYFSELEEEEEDENEEDEEEEACVLSLPDLPGGSEAFELAAKFCYGVKIELSASNVAPLRCSAEYLEMTEEFSESNLIAKTETFLNQRVLKRLTDSVKALKSCETLIPVAENLNIVQKCIDSIAMNASSDPSLFGWPVTEQNGAILQGITSPRGAILWNGIETGLRPRNPIKPDWWFEEVTVLSLPFYKRLISAMKTRGLSSETLEGSLICYAKKFIPGLQRRNRASYSQSSTSSGSIASELEQRELLEEVVSHLPTQNGPIYTNTNANMDTNTKFLFGLLRTANILNTSEFCRATIEKRIGMKLHQASLDDLLLPSYSYLIETLYDIECVARILGYFLEGRRNIRSSTAGEREEEDEEGDGDGEEEEEFEGSPARNPLILVGKLIDGYLAEVASDANLRPEKFYDLAIALPDQARVFDDGLYRAVDVYLKAHPLISEEEREKICSVMDCQKLTLEACTHAAQNERLPLRIVVQVLFFEQLQLRHVIAGNLLSYGQPAGNLIFPSQPAGNLEFPAPDSGQAWRAALRENQVLRLDMDSMSARVKELERECSTMRKAIEMIGKFAGEKKGNSGPKLSAKVDGKNGAWGSLTKKFGCKFKTQVCDSHEGTVIEAKGRHARTSTSTSLS